jgi:O-antigen ligase
MGLGLFWLVVSADYSRLKLIYSMLAGAFLSAGLGIWQFLNQAAFASKWLGLAEHQGIDLGASVIEAVGSDGVGERWLRAYGAMDHPNVLGGVLALGIIFTVYQIIAYEKSSGFSIFDFRFSNKMQNANPPAILRDNFSAQGGSASGRQTIFNDKIFNFINWLMILVFTAALFFSFSRSAWLALAAGLIVIIVFTVAGGNLKRQRALAEIILAMGILVFVVFSQYQNLVVARLNSEGRLETKSNFERLASYKEAWRLIQDDSLIGVGPGNYTLALNRLLPWQESYYYQPTHNVFLLIWSEIGIFGLLSFLGMIVYLIIINFSPFTKASEDKQFFPLRQGFGGQVIFNEGFENLSIGNCLKIVNCKLKIRNSYLAKNLMFNTSVLIALIVLMFFDHWLWSLHFGVLYFWLVLGLVVTPLAKVSPAGAGDFSGKVKYKSP